MEHVPVDITVNLPEDIKVIIVIYILFLYANFGLDIWKSVWGRLHM